MKDFPKIALTTFNNKKKQEQNHNVSDLKKVLWIKIEHTDFYQRM